MPPQSLAATPLVVAQEDIAILRVPTQGGEPSLLRGDKLTAVNWRFVGNLPTLTRPLSIDRDQKVVYFASAKGALVGIDLNARNAQIRLPVAKQLAGSTDGMVFGLDTARRAIRFASRGLTTYKTKVIPGAVQLFRAPGGQVSVFSGQQHLLQVLGDGGETRRFDVPDGVATASWFGDLIAISNDSGVTLVEQTPSRNGVSFFKVRGTPIVAAFSPSGHRIYVTLQKAEISVVDRFSRSIVSDISLPAVATQLRVDRSGRWLMAAPERGDSLWLIDVLLGQVVGTYATPWREDLPEVVGANTLLIRQGKDLVAFSVDGPKPTEKLRLRDAAEDLFVPVYWLPGKRPSTAGVTAAAALPPVTGGKAEPAKGDPLPSDPAGAAGAKGGATEAWYLQLSSSQNQSFAEALSEQLAGAGYPAKVVPPKTADQGFRVILGPYPSHDAADSIGKRLGRAYFVMMLDPPDR